MKRKLTAKQQKFADEYIKSGNKYESAVKAGYSESYARSHAEKLSENVGIKNYVDERMAEIASSKIAKSDEVLKYYTSVLRGEAVETVVVTTSDSVHTVKKPPDLKTRIAAGKELMKRYPDSNKLVDAQVRKLEAEADIVEAKANDIKNAQNGKDSTLIVDDLGDVDDDD